MPVLEYDFGDFQVGTAEDETGATGVTLLSFPRGGLAAADPRGGAVTGRCLQLCSLTDPSGRVDALAFTGGGSAGLDAATGVERALRQKRGGPSRVVAAAISEAEGGPSPDGALGEQALARAKVGRVALGRAGAGAGATVGGWFGLEHASPAGQGAAFFEWAGVKLFALSVVNALGNVIDERGAIVAGVQRAGGGYDPVVDRIGRTLAGASNRSLPPTGHSTLSAVVTNLEIGRADLYRLAVMAHAATARVIDPLWAPDDGDVAFAVSTGGKATPRDLRIGDLGALAGRVVQQAITSAVR